MKKEDKEFEKMLEEQLDQEITTASLDNKPELKARLYNIVDNNKQVKAKVNIIRRTALAICALILVVSFSILIPTWVKDDDNTPPTKYYGDNDVVQVQLTEEFLIDYINTNIPNYNFIFEDCNVSEMFGLYDKETETELLALMFIANVNNTPVSLKVNIILNKNYTFSEHTKYITNATIESENPKVYVKEPDDPSNYYILTLVERSNYDTYINANINDTILDKFKQN